MIDDLGKKVLFTTAMTTEGAHYQLRIVELLQWDYGEYSGQECNGCAEGGRWSFVTIEFHAPNDADPTHNDATPLTLRLPNCS